MRLCIGAFLFDPLGRLLVRDGGRPAALTPKAARLLEALAEAAPEPVPHAALYERLWAGTFVEPGNLHNLVAEIREAAGDTALIKTVHRFGYALAERAVGEARARFALLVGEERIELPEGETIVGRDQLEGADVSRRHARITVEGLTASIEDLGSKNGTFIGTRRITAVTALRDRDEIVFGRTRTRFAALPAAETTITAAPPLSGSRG
ncbi:MAG: garA 4 [Acidobacteria bacterium]|nr:garA 4 [Acidobacteriota bacterium]